jgi:hypothetical protein
MLAPYTRFLSIDSHIALALRFFWTLPRDDSPCVLLTPAQSARGISPRAAHRSGREPSIHPARATPRKPTGFRQDKEFLRLPVASIPTWVTCFLRSTRITPLPRYYEAVRPWLIHRYFQPCVVPLVPFPLL